MYLSFPLIKSLTIQFLPNREPNSNLKIYLILIRYCLNLK